MVIFKERDLKSAATFNQSERLQGVTEKKSKKTKFAVPFITANDCVSIKMKKVFIPQSVNKEPTIKNIDSWHTSDHLWFNILY